MPAAAILAGGLATRLRPITETIPKSLIDINGEPFLAHQLRLLKSKGIDRVVLCVGHLGDKVQEFSGDGSRFGLNLSYSFDGPQLRGTAGAIHQALPLLGGTFFVVYGDSYLPCDYAAVAASFQKSGKRGLMTVFRNQGAWDTSNVEFDGERIAVYDKRLRTPQMQHIDYGLGMFQRDVFTDLAPGSVRDLAEVYQDLLAKNQLAAFEIHERFYEIGSLAGIADLSEALQSGRFDR